MVAHCIRSKIRRPWLSIFSLLIVTLIAAGCRETIVHDLNESEANRLLSRLNSVRIEAKKENQPDGRWSISVAESEVVSAISFLDSSRFSTSRIAAAPLANQAGIIPSREDEAFRYERSVSSALESTLLAMHGVLEARVHLNLPQEDPLLGARGQSHGSGAVLLVVEDDFSAKDDEVSALVGGAAGISASSVRIMRTTASQDSRNKSGTQESLVGADLAPQPERGTAIDTFEVRTVLALSALGGGVLALFGVLYRRHRRGLPAFPLSRSARTT